MRAIMSAPALLTPLLAAWGLLLGGTLGAADGKVFVYVSGYAPAISCFTLDTASGTLTPASSSPGGTNPSFLAWSADHRFMYALNESDPMGKIASFKIDPVNGSLTRINDASAAGKGTCHLAVHPGGKWLATANYGSGHVGILPIKPDGSVGEPVDTELPGKNAHQALWDDSGAFLFVPCLGSDYIYQYRFDAATGKLTPNEPATVATQPGAGPRHLAFNPKRTFAYGINELGSTITTYTYDAAKGLLSAVNVVTTLPANFASSGVRNSTAEIQVAASGNFLYGSNRGHNSIAIYRLDPASGLPTFMNYETGGGDIKIPRHFSFDATGTLALVASQNGNCVTIFKVDPAAGTLSKVTTLPVAAGPSFVAAMPAP